jgi:epoxyqueuosine reductase
MFTVFFFNPNVHPLLEFRRRLKAVQVLADHERLPLVAAGAYGLESFLDALGPRRSAPDRCRVCYQMRLDAAAAHAAAHAFPRFTSTLLVSPQQDREAICRIGHEAASRHGVTFLDTDWRARHDLGLDLARRRQLYRQQYCGCIFSEADRYRDSAEHLYRPQSLGRVPA